MVKWLNQVPATRTFTRRENLVCIIINGPLAAGATAIMELVSILTHSIKKATNYNQVQLQEVKHIQRANNYKWVSSNNSTNQGLVSPGSQTPSPFHG